MDVADEDCSLRTLRQLKAEKRNGVLDAQEKLIRQDVKWRDSVDYDVLRDYLKHRNEKNWTKFKWDHTGSTSFQIKKESSKSVHPVKSSEVRLETIALLVESRKTTQSFTRAELELVEFFLNYNIGEKLEFVPFIKKTLKRLKDSMAVLCRQLARAEKIRNFEKTIGLDSPCRGGDREKINGEPSVDAINSLIDAYKEFLSNLRSFCVNNLYPGAGYDRRRSSLHILCLEQEIFDGDWKNLSWDERQAKILFDRLLLDTYESNKEMAYKILKTMDPILLGLNDETIVREIVEVAVGLANSIRPIDTITAAYLFKILIFSPVIKDVVASSIHDTHLALVAFLLKQLEKPLEIARQNIVVAASMHSLYGFLFCLRSLLSNCDLTKLAGSQSWRSTIGDLVEMCFNLNEVVSPIVNNSSPEGHLPMDLNPSNLEATKADDDSDTEKVTSQMVLLCAWRTVKEVSLLFGHLTAKSTISDCDTTVGLLTNQQVVRIGEHLVTLLSETKHRGAFEQAHVGFSQLCTRLWRLEDKRLNQMPKVWLHRLLLAVTGLAPGDSKLCATRRSAGVPFMVQALLTSEPITQDVATSAFSSSMKILLGLANMKDDADLEARMKGLIYEDTAFTELQASTTALTRSFDRTDAQSDESVGDVNGVTEVKTHALNMLRALYKHSQLGELVRPYIAEGVISAIKSCNAKTWAERNAGTLLFSAMIVRIFGVQRTKDHLNLSVHNRMTGKVFFERFPSLLGFMLSELKAFLKPGRSLIRPSLQSVLLLLSRLYPSCHDGADSDWRITDFINLVSRCAKSRDYETRELAARALVPLLTETTAPVALANLFQTLPSSSPKCSELNTVHGYLLQVLEIARSHQFAKFEPSGTAFKDYMRKSSWILKDLENGTKPQGNFTLASTYVEALTEIYKANHKWFNDYGQNKDDDVVARIQHHLSQGTTLKLGAGREIYEMAAAKFYLLFISSGSRSSRCDDAWTVILSHSNNHLQSVAWAKAADLGTEAFDSRLVQEAILTAEQKIQNYIDHPQARETVYEFLYTVLTNVRDLRTIENLLGSILSRLTADRDHPHFDLNASYLRLLGQVYGKVSGESISLLRKKEVYELFFENSWMDSSEINCRIAISQTMVNLFEPISSKNDYFVLLWWTMLLNLIVDDDATVRRHAAVTIAGIEPGTELECDASMRRVFFHKFSKTVGIGRPDVAMAALFLWGLGTPREGDYEMDETDVFNRCRNYECFEQPEISDLSFRSMKQISEENQIDKLQSPIIEWLKKCFQCEFSFATLQELAAGYEECLPAISYKLDDFLDPFCCNKLQRVLAFGKFESLVSSLAVS